MENSDGVRNSRLSHTGEKCVICEFVFFLSFGCGFTLFRSLHASFVYTASIGPDQQFFVVTQGSVGFHVKYRCLPLHPNMDDPYSWVISSFMKIKLLSLVLVICLLHFKFALFLRILLGYFFELSGRYLYTIFVHSLSVASAQLVFNLTKGPIGSQVSGEFYQIYIIFPSLSQC